MGKRIATAVGACAVILAVGAWAGLETAGTGHSSAHRAGLPAVGAVYGGAATGRPRSSATGQAAPPQGRGRPTGRGSPAPSPGGRAAARPLAGQVVGIDPGHNGLNYSDPSYLSQQVWNGRAMENCDTTGTQTDSGYPESLFTFRVAQFLRADLIADGATVVMTRSSDSGVGPCVDRRARILNRAHPAVAVDIHADGGPSWGRGFSILEPVADGPNNNVIASSARLGADVKAALLAGAPMPVSDYYGTGGIQLRDDLAGLNLATEPKVLIECGNMRNAADARLLTSTRFQRELAKAFTAAIITFLAKR